jgi:hypothetical protein
VRIITLLTQLPLLILFFCSLQILSNPEFSECICWNPHGRSWRILKPPVFEQVVIPLYFRHAKYASFMRQVNGWGFKRIVSGNDHNSYYHEMFVREFPQLCLKMQRIKKGEASEKTKKGEDGAEKDVDDHESPESSDQQGEALAPANQYQQQSIAPAGGAASGFPGGLAGFTGGAPPGGLTGYTGGAPPGGLSGYPGGAPPGGLAGYTGGAPPGGLAGYTGGAPPGAPDGLSGLTGGAPTGAPGGSAVGVLSGLAGFAGAPTGGDIGQLSGLAGLTGGAHGGAPGGGLSALAGMMGGAPSGGGMGGLQGLAGLTGGAPTGAPGVGPSGLDSAMILKFQEALAAAGGPNALLHQQQQLGQPPQNLQPGGGLSALAGMTGGAPTGAPGGGLSALAGMTGGAPGNNFGFPSQNPSQFGGQNASVLAAQLQAATQKPPTPVQHNNSNGGGGGGDSDDDDLDDDDDDDNSSVTSGEAV